MNDKIVARVIPNIPDAKNPGLTIGGKNGTIRSVIIKPPIMARAVTVKRNALSSNFSPPCIFYLFNYNGLCVIRQDWMAH
jgi:hypothetical protein